MNMDLYRPCPCGSGKKFKFCCKEKQREQSPGPALLLLSGSDELPQWSEVSDEFRNAVLGGDPVESLHPLRAGMKLMNNGKYKDAVPFFKKAHKTAPFVYSALNNQSLCLMAIGKLDEAIAAQQQAFKDSPLPNPFGMANLAALLLMAGNDEDAESALDVALFMKPTHGDACLKICESLARFKRHQAILDYADRCAFGDYPGISFFTGIAAANLGNTERALEDLRRVSPRHPKWDMAWRYLKHLKQNMHPHTVMGDWPYLMSYEICAYGSMADEMTKAIGWGSRSIAVKLCEALLNETEATRDTARELLQFLKHPDCINLLLAIVKGSLGTDDLRKTALFQLQQRGEIKRNQSVNMLIDGKRIDVCTAGTTVNPDLRYGPPLPAKLEKRYAIASERAMGHQPDWNKLGPEFQAIAQAAPNYYPARYNYAASLLNRGRIEEAEPIMRKILDEAPDYLFAPATLLQIYIRQNRNEDARELIRKIHPPEVAHPMAFVAWMIAQAMFYSQQGDLKAATECIDTAHSIDPDHPYVKKLRAARNTLM